MPRQTMTHIGNLAEERATRIFFSPLEFRFKVFYYVHTKRLPRNFERVSEALKKYKKNSLRAKKPNKNETKSDLADL